MKVCTALKADADKQETGLAVSFRIHHKWLDKYSESVVNLANVAHSVQVDSEIEPARAVHDNPLDRHLVTINLDQYRTLCSAFVNTSPLKISGINDMRIRME